jgi:lipoprotein-releasing system ATP-binding protein
VADDVVQLEGVVKAYNPGTSFETVVLHGIDFSLARGEFCALIGPSGSGKSTLLNIIGLLDRPTRGKLYIEGRDTSALNDTELTRLRGRSIGFIFQEHHLITAFTAAENVMMPLLVDRGRVNDAMEKRAAELIEEVGLTKWKDNRSANMSGGQQQRVAVARALAMHPVIILADEPTGNLDTVSAEGVFELIGKVNRINKTTILLVTHNMDLAGRCPRIIEVVDGRIKSDRPGQAASIQVPALAAGGPAP